MSTAALANKAHKKSKTAAEAPGNVQSTRETIESVVVAFILAFLFRAFVAEAFVIPTGSMAPTLMGAHKDIACEFCGQQFQAGVSSEFNSETGRLTNVATIASTCSVCRGVNGYDLRGNPNHKSFSGDRILVSKFDYVLYRPKRWDVFVFKFPDKARMNYIKRLVGLPGEMLLIRDGDVYTRTDVNSEWTIARKPPHKVKAMRQIVSDTNHLAPILAEQGVPSLWQPWGSEQSLWTVEQAADRWSAVLSPSTEPQWLRYYHNFVDEADWLGLLAGERLPPVAKRSSRLITDYLAYNSSFKVERGSVYTAGNKLYPEIDGDVTALDLEIRDAQQRLAMRVAEGRELTREVGLDSLLRVEREDGPDNDGRHWVGDLVGDFRINVKSDSGRVLLDLVEFGLHYQCAIDVATGQATLTASDQGVAASLFNGASQLTADTNLQGPGSYRLEMANVDDQLVVWINGRVVKFSQPAVFDSRAVRAGAARRPYWSPADPLDAAPVGIGGQGIELEITRAVVYRDIYYIAVQGGDFSDFNIANSRSLWAAVPDKQLRDQAARDQFGGQRAISAIYSHPEWWSETNLFSLRGELEFQLEDEQYFPMGDNSAASSDARVWHGHNFVEKKFLLGKALLVFWPHTWNSPVPFTPNFARMGLIR